MWAKPDQRWGKDKDKDQGCCSAVFFIDFMKDYFSTPRKNQSHICKRLWMFYRITLLKNLTKFKERQYFFSVTLGIT